MVDMTGPNQARLDALTYNIVLRSDDTAVYEQLTVVCTHFMVNEDGLTRFYDDRSVVVLAIPTPVIRYIQRVET